MLHPHSLYYDHLKPEELEFLRKVADFCAREIAPYVGIGWSWRPGDTGDYAQAAGEEDSEFNFLAGLRAWF